jgi:LacI family transcriptional regulator
MPEDLSRFCCLNESCPELGKRGLDNLTVCARYGKDKRRRMLYCRTCKARFSERKGTPLFGSQLSEDQALAIFEHLAERNGVRATARLVRVNRNTVVRYARLAGGHAQQLHVAGGDRVGGYDHGDGPAGPQDGPRESAAAEDELCHEGRRPG